MDSNQFKRFDSPLLGSGFTPKILLGGSAKYSSCNDLNVANSNGVDTNSNGANSKILHFDNGESVAKVSHTLTFLL